MKKSAVITLGLVAGLAAWGVGIYGSILNKEKAIKESWATMDEHIQKRNELIPDLISTAKIYASEEYLLFEEIDSTINTIEQQKIDTNDICAEKIEQYLQTQNELSLTLDKLTALQETHQQLQECQTFQDLQSSLQEHKTQIAVDLSSLKSQINLYNNSLEKFPNKFIAQWFNFAPIKVECKDSNNDSQD